MRRYISLLLFIGFAWGQPADSWIQTFGGSDSDYGSSVQQTTDGGYVVTGRTMGDDVYGSSDVWLIKTDSQGQEEWNHTFGGENYEYGSSVQQTTDGGYIITGYTSSFGNGQNDVWLIKTDSQGQEEWNQTFGGNMFDIGQSGQQTDDGGYVIIGNSMSFYDESSVIWLIKTDSQGDSIWTQTFIGWQDDYGNSWAEGESVQQTSDGGYILAGKTFDLTNENDGWLIKTDSQGQEEWNQTFGSQSYDEFLSLQQTSDGGYIITGNTYSYGSVGVDQGDVWLIKTDGQGQEEWNQTFNDGNNDRGLSVQQTTDGGFIITGTWDTSNGGDILLIKTNSGGLVSPELGTIDDQQMLEDGSITLEISATSNLGLDMTFSVYSDTSDVIVSLDNTTLTATPEPDWYGTANITVMVTDENDLYDITDFTLTVTPVNDSPEPFSVLYPAISDTFSTHVDSDTAIVFNWEESYDVDSDVTYTLTIELEFFGITYTDVHENISDTTISISSNSLDPLLNANNQDMATFTYYVISSDGEYMVLSDVGEFVLFRAALGVNEGLSVPVMYALHQNYPNPFNPVTTLQYDLPEDAMVNITIYDMMGRVVSNLVSSQQNAGYKSIQWNATNNAGQPISAGLYLYTIEVGEFRQTKKMVLLK